MPDSSIDGPLGQSQSAANNLYKVPHQSILSRRTSPSPYSQTCHAERSEASPVHAPEPQSRPEFCRAPGLLHSGMPSQPGKANHKREDKSKAFAVRLTDRDSFDILGPSPGQNRRCLLLDSLARLIYGRYPASGCCHCVLPRSIRKGGEGKKKYCRLAGC